MVNKHRYQIWFFYQLKLVQILFQHLYPRKFLKIIHQVEPFPHSTKTILNIHQYLINPCKYYVHCIHLIIYYLMLLLIILIICVKRVPFFIVDPPFNFLINFHLFNGSFSKIFLLILIFLFHLCWFKTNYDLKFPLLTISPLVHSK